MKKFEKMTEEETKECENIQEDLAVDFLAGIEVVVNKLLEKYGETPLRERIIYKMFLDTVISALFIGTTDHEVLEKALKEDLIAKVKHARKVAEKCQKIIIDNEVLRFKLGMKAHQGYVSSIFLLKKSLPYLKEKKQ